MPEYLPVMMSVLAIVLFTLGFWWFLYHYCNRIAKQVYTEGNPMDHQDLELMIKSGQHDVRLTVNEAGELLAEFGRMKAHLNDALDRKVELHRELESVKKVANDQALLVSKLTNIVRMAQADYIEQHSDGIRDCVTPYDYY